MIQANCITLCERTVHRLISQMPTTSPKAAAVWLAAWQRSCQASPSPAAPWPAALLLLLPLLLTPPPWPFLLPPSLPALLLPQLPPSCAFPGVRSETPGCPHSSASGEAPSQPLSQHMVWRSKEHPDGAFPSPFILSLTLSFPAVDQKYSRGARQSSTHSNKKATAPQTAANHPIKSYTVVLAILLLPRSGRK